MPSEHQMITVFLKRYQEKDPFIQAIGGGSKFWKGIEEGREKSIKKGENEAKERSSGDKRTEYVWAKL